jgi:hypothetical protein
VTVLGPMSRGPPAVADIGGSLCLSCSINIHQDRVNRGGVGMGKAGGGWPVSDKGGRMTHRSRATGHVVCGGRLGRLHQQHGFGPSGQRG